MKDRAIFKGAPGRIVSSGDLFRVHINGLLHSSRCVQDRAWTLVSPSFCTVAKIVLLRGISPLVFKKKKPSALHLQILPYATRIRTSIFLLSIALSIYLWIVWFTTLHVGLQLVNPLCFCCVFLLLLLHSIPWFGVPVVDLALPKRVVCRRLAFFCS